jgi:hypothetical protein
LQTVKYSFGSSRESYNFDERKEYNSAQKSRNEGMAGIKSNLQPELEVAGQFPKKEVPAPQTERGTTSQFKEDSARKAIDRNLNTMTFGIPYAYGKGTLNSAESTPIDERAETMERSSSAYGDQNANITSPETFDSSNKKNRKNRYDNLEYENKDSARKIERTPSEIEIKNQNKERKEENNDEVVISEKEESNKTSEEEHKLQKQLEETEKLRIESQDENDDIFQAPTGFDFQKLNANENKHNEVEYSADEFKLHLNAEIQKLQIKKTEEPSKNNDEEAHRKGFDDLFLTKPNDTKLSSSKKLNELAEMKDVPMIQVKQPSPDIEKQISKDPETNERSNREQMSEENKQPLPYEQNSNEVKYENADIWNKMELEEKREDNYEAILEEEKGNDSEEEYDMNEWEDSLNLGKDLQEESKDKERIIEQPLEQKSSRMDGEMKKPGEKRNWISEGGEEEEEEDMITAALRKQQLQEQEERKQQEEESKHSAILEAPETTNPANLISPSLFSESDTYSSIITFASPQTQQTTDRQSSDSNQIQLSPQLGSETDSKYSPSPQQQHLSPPPHTATPNQNQNINSSQRTPASATSSAQSPSPVPSPNKSSPLANHYGSGGVEKAFFRRMLDDKYKQNLTQNKNIIYEDALIQIGAIRNIQNKNAVFQLFFANKHTQIHVTSLIFKPIFYDYTSKYSTN